MSNFVDGLQKVFKSKTFIIIFSIVIAVISWFVVIDSTNPNSEDSITVNLSYLNSDIPFQNDLTKVSDTDAVSIKIKVSGRKKLISELSAADFSVNADLSSVTKAGEYELEIQKPTCKKMGIKVVDYSPKTVTASYDKKIEKSVSVKIPDVEKYLAEGYELMSVTTEPSSIPFSGYSGELEDLDHIEIDLASQITTIDENMHLTYIAKFISDTGVDISSDFDTEKIKVNIYVAKRVPVNFDITGKPTSDCYLDTVSKSHESILVYASDDLYSKDLKKLEAIDLGTIDIAGKSSAFDEKFDIKQIIGEHLEVANDEDTEVMLSILISQKEVRKFNILWSNVEFSNSKNDDLDYVIDNSPLKISSEQKFVIELKAKPADFEKMNETAIDISLSYPQEACEKQIHNLTIKLPENIEAVGEYIVYITATEKVTQTEEETGTDETENTPSQQGNT